MKSPKNTQVIGNASLYYVCWKLSVPEWGLSVTITARNAKAVDAFVYNPSSGKHASLQIKTDSDNNGICPDGRRGNSPEDKTLDGAKAAFARADFWVIVRQGAPYMSWVCQGKDGKDADLLEEIDSGKRHGFGFKPYKGRSKNSHELETRREKWKTRQDEKGWELIRKHLS